MQYALPKLNKETLDFGEGENAFSVSVHGIGSRHIREAREVASQSQLANLRLLGGEVVRSIRSERAEDIAEKPKEHPEDATARLEAHYAQFDMDTVVGAGVESCTLPLVKGGTLGRALAEVGDEVMVRVFRAILDLSVPNPDHDMDEEGKGDSGACTSY